MKASPFLLLAFLGLLPLAGRAQQAPMRENDSKLEEKIPLSPSSMALLDKRPGPAVAAPLAVKLLADRRNAVLDVRTPEEFAAGHLAGARNVNFRAPDFAQQVAKLDKTRPYVLYCASGNRSSQAATVMQQQGFKHVTNAGGYQELKAAGAK